MIAQAVSRHLSERWLRRSCHQRSMAIPATQGRRASSPRERHVTQWCRSHRSPRKQSSGGEGWRV